MHRVLNKKYEYTMYGKFFEQDTSIKFLKLFSSYNNTYETTKIKFIYDFSCKIKRIKFDIKIIEQIPVENNLDTVLKIERINNVS